MNEQEALSYRHVMTMTEYATKKANSKTDGCLSRCSMNRQNKRMRNPKSIRRKLARLERVDPQIDIVRIIYMLAPEVKKALPTKVDRACICL